MLNTIADIVGNINDRFHIYYLTIQLEKHAVHENNYNKAIHCRQMMMKTPMIYEVLFWEPCMVLSAGSSS